jgi:hypothetical protein
MKLSDVTTWHKDFITYEDGVYVCWDESAANIITITDSVEDAIDVLDTYAATLEP